jgi:hypothetical protein
MIAQFKPENQYPLCAGVCIFWGSGHGQNSRIGCCLGQANFLPEQGAADLEMGGGYARQVIRRSRICSQNAAAVKVLMI